MIPFHPTSTPHRPLLSFQPLCGSSRCGPCDSHFLLSHFPFLYCLCLFSPIILFPLGFFLPFAPTPLSQCWVASFSLLSVFFWHQCTPSATCLSGFDLFPTFPLNVFLYNPCIRRLRCFAFIFPKKNVPTLRPLPLSSYYLRVPFLFFLSVTFLCLQNNITLYKFPNTTPYMCFSPVRLPPRHLLG